MARPTREELKEANKEAIAPLQTQMGKIEDLLQKRIETDARSNEQAQLHRALVGDSLAEIRTSIALMKQRQDVQIETAAKERRLTG